MFNNAPLRHSRHLTTTVRTRSAWKNETMMKEDLARNIKSDILNGKPETAFSVITRPKTEGDYLKSAHSLHVPSKQHPNSTTAKSIEARKKQLEFEAAKEIAEIARKNAQVEKSLIEKKLAMEIAALESASKSRRSSLCLQIKNDSFELSARKINKQILPLQKLSNLKIKDYAHLNNVKSYISCSEKVKPKLIIGQDNHSLIAPTKTIMRNKNEPCATQTQIGKCVRGTCPSKHQCSASECAMITVEQLRRSPAPASSCLSRHACTRAVTTTYPLVTAHTGACETTADATRHYTLTSIPEKVTTYKQIPTKQREVLSGWISQLEKIKHFIRIPRWYYHSQNQVSCKESSEIQIISSSNKINELHLLCDASLAACAAIAYWRVYITRNVAPITKPTVIPCLQDVVLACRLADDFIQKKHRLQWNEICFLMDSMPVLFWTKNYIVELSKLLTWYYNQSENTKIEILKLYKDCKWLKSSSFLYENDSFWMTATPEKEKRKINEMKHHLYEAEYYSLPVPDPDGFSLWFRFCTVMILLIVEEIMNTCKKETISNLLQRAQILFTRNAKMQSFSTKINLLKNDKKIYKYQRAHADAVHIGEWGILRIGRVATTNVQNARSKGIDEIALSGPDECTTHCGNKYQVWSVSPTCYSLGAASCC